MKNILFSGIHKLFNILASQQAQHPDQTFPNLVSSILITFERLRSMTWQEIMLKCSPVEIFVAQYSINLYHILRCAYPVDAGRTAATQATR